MIGGDIKSPKEDKDERVERLMSSLQRGINRRKEEEKAWDHVEKFDNMKQWDGKAGSGDDVTVNKVGSFIRNYRAQVCYNDPRCKLTPKTSDGWEPIQVPIIGPDGQPKMDEMGQVIVREVVRSQARETLINDILASPKAKTQQTGALLTKSGVTGWGCLKSYYKPIVETAIEPEGEQMIPVKDDRLDLSGFARNPIDGSLVQDEATGRLISRSSIPVNEDFGICWVNYRNIIIDPDGGNYWDDHRWIAEEEIRSLEEVKKDPLFKNTGDLQCSGKRVDDGDKEPDWGGSGSDWSEESSEKGDEDRKIVRLFHVYDLVNQRYIVLADGHGKELRNVGWDEIGITDHPYSDFRPNQILGEFYPRPLGGDLTPINEWYNIARRYELRAMQRSNRKGFSRKGAINAMGMEQLTNDEDMAWVELDIGKHESLADQILPFTPPPVNDALYANSKMIAMDFDEVAGMTSESRGVAKADTATQVNVMEAGSSVRIQHDRKVLSETYRSAFKKLNDLLDAHMTTERAIRLQGTDGQTFVGLIDPDMIAGDYDVSVDFMDMAPPNTAQQAAGRAQIAQIAGQAPHLFMSEPLVRGWLEPYGIKDQNFIEALVEASKMQMQMMQMMQGQQAPGPVPEAGAPQDEAQALKQNAAGTQVPRMQGAS